MFIPGKEHLVPSGGSVINFFQYRAEGVSKTLSGPELNAMILTCEEFLNNPRLPDFMRPLCEAYHNFLSIEMDKVIAKNVKEIEEIKDKGE